MLPVCRSRSGQSPTARATARHGRKEGSHQPPGGPRAPERACTISDQSLFSFTHTRRIHRHTHAFTPVLCRLTKYGSNRVASTSHLHRGASTMLPAAYYRHRPFRRRVADLSIDHVCIASAIASRAQRHVSCTSCNYFISGTCDWVRCVWQLDGREPRRADCHAS